MSSLQTFCTSTSTSINPAVGGLKDWWLLTKPGIVCGNMVSIAGAFFMAARGQPDYLLFAAVLLGVSLVVASACVANNIYDRDIDARMQRTCRRALVVGSITPRAAAVFALMLGVCGFALLAILANGLAVAMALAGYVIYLGVYTVYLKRRSVHATLVGSLSGAAPPLVAYCAVTGRFDAGALVVLLMFSLWQMPHSYAIAIYREVDFRRAGIPLLPLVRGLASARRQMAAYIAAFGVAAILLMPYAHVGYAYGLTVGVLTIYWLYSLLPPRDKDTQRWARQQFIYSIVMVTVLSLVMAVDYLVV